MGSGRTDAGVHALRQVAHLDVRKALPAETLRRGINDSLPADIHVLAVDTRAASLPRAARAPSRAATSIRSRDAGARLRNRSCGG